MKDEREQAYEGRFSLRRSLISLVYWLMAIVPFFCLAAGMSGRRDLLRIGASVGALLAFAVLYLIKRQGVDDARQEEMAATRGEPADP